MHMENIYMCKYICVHMHTYTYTFHMHRYVHIYTQRYIKLKCLE